MRAGAFAPKPFLLAALLFFFSFLDLRMKTVVSVSGDQTPSVCQNLDIVFIIDQSDSMNGPGGRNDPYDQRVAAVRNMIDYLVDLALDRCPGSYHRVGVISFGGRGNNRVDVPFTDIYVRNENEVPNLRRRLKERITPAALGWTYPFDAFDQAHQMLNDAPAAPSPRKRAIIFVTDGYPCLTQEQCSVERYYEPGLNFLKAQIDDLFIFENSLRKREDCLNKLRDLYQDEIPPEKTTACLEQFPVTQAEYQRSTYLFTLLIRDMNAPESRYYNSILENITRSYGGELYRLSQDGRDIPSTMRAIISRLSGVQASPFSCGSFAVNPYLKRVVINAYKNSPEVKVTLSYHDAQGNFHEIRDGKHNGQEDTSIEYTQESANERYSIAFPYPGIWSITSTATRCEDIEVYYDEANIVPRPYPPLSQVPIFSHPPYYNQEAPKYITYQLIDRNSGSVIVPSDKAIFAINVMAKVTAPDGSTKNYVLTWDDSKQMFVASSPLEIPLPGMYRLEVRGETKRHEGKPAIQSADEYEVFSAPYTVFEVSSQFEGLSVQEIRLEAIKPGAGENAGPIHATIAQGWPLKTLPLVIRARLVDEGGNPLNVMEIFSNPDTAVLAYLKWQSANGEQKSQPLALHPSDVNPNELVGEFVSDEIEGEKTLVIEIAPEANEEALSKGYWAYQRVLEVPFKRVDCLFCRASTYYGLLALSVVIVIALIGYNIAIRTNKVSGTLVFLDGTTRLAEFSLYNGKNFRDIKGRELSSYPQLELKRLRVQNAQRRARRKPAAEEEPFGLGTETAPAVRVDCVMRSGRKFSIDLYPNAPTSYGEETMAQMLYEPVIQS